MKRIILLVVACLILGAPLALSEDIAVSTSTLSTSQQYETKLIFEGKWGDGPGEFGPGKHDGEGPTSLSVDSKGNIYILDFLNSRIQKFDMNGKFILSIPVESMTDKSGRSVIKKEIATDGHRKTRITQNPSTFGVNIVINSKDTLYYYLVRNHDIKSKKGEVWEFRDDKLIRKYTNLPAKALEIEADDSLWMTWIDKDPNRNYSILDNKYYTQKHLKEKKNNIKNRLKKEYLAKNKPLQNLVYYRIVTEHNGIKVYKDMRRTK